MSNCDCNQGRLPCSCKQNDTQSELAALREELARIKGISDNYYSLLVDANQSLAAAEQRNAELEKNAARYIWLRDKSESVHQFYLSTPIWFTGVKFNQESVDSTIDAAMAKPTESDLCAACDGAGSVSTGIAEASSTICNKCDGTGTKPTESGASE
jgi:hypothetical protein